MWLQLLSIVGGGACLYFGAEWLVGGAAGLARALGMKPLVIGLTVVAFGTSAPELVVSLTAALEGHSAIALGNVVGSNIANLGLILGVTALIAPPLVESTLIRREVPALVLSQLALPLLLWNGELSRLEGALLVLAGVGLTWFSIRAAQREPGAQPDKAEVAEHAKQEAAKGSRAKLVGLTLAGLVVLVVGGKLFVDGASGLAAAFGVSDRVIGLTVVAIGTSLPELAASLVAALKGHSAIAVGNVVGSNLYNVLFILGGAALARPLSADLKAMAVDLWVLMGMTVLGVVFLRGERSVSRAEGAVLATTYLGFLTWLAVGG